MSRIAGIILAGGRSSRFGRDKALVEIGGVSLLDRARALVRDAGAGVAIVAGRGEEPDGLADPAPHDGPAVAARHALHAAFEQGFKAAWVLPVDAPLLTPGLLHRLRDAGADAAAFAGHPLPFFARLSADAPAAGAASVHGLLDELGAVRIAAGADVAAALASVNTPEDLEKIQVLLGG